MTPLLILVFTKNQASLLGRCLASIALQWVPSDTWILDGCSTDDTVAVGDRHGVRVITRPDTGPNDAIRQAILELPPGRIVGIQSSSDAYALGAFDEAVRAMTHDRHLAYIAGSARTHEGDHIKVEWVGGSRHITWRTLRAFPRPGVWPVGWLQAAFFRSDLLRDMVQGGDWPAAESCHGPWLFTYLCRALAIGDRARVTRRVWADFYRHEGNRQVSAEVYWRDRRLAFETLRGWYPELTPWWRRG